MQIKNLKDVIKYATFSTCLIPAAAEAATFADLVNDAVGVINLAIPVVAGLIVLTFFWGIARYVFSSADSGEKGAGKELIIWGLVALFIAFSLWGLVSIFARVFGINISG